MTKILSRSIMVAAAAILSCANARAEPVLPKPEKILFWSPQDQITAYQNMEKIFPTNLVRKDDAVHPLPAAKTIDVTYTYKGESGDASAYMAHNHVAGLLVIKDGKIVLEKYRLGLTETGRWTSFSVGKSITSTLVGAAIKDGYISSVNDPITRYIPELKGSAYDGVRIADVLEMRSGVRWNEDYEDPNSDVGRMTASLIQNRGLSLVQYMSKLPREAPIGSKFTYKTGESNMLGVLVNKAVGKSLSEYLSEKIWAPYGMQEDAVWLTDGGHEVGGCCLSISLRDYGRFAEFFMHGGEVHGRRILPDNWMRDATKTYSQHAFGDLGYGYQWWTHDDGSFEAIGIFGQDVFIDAAHDLVVVTLSAWPEADWEEGYAREAAFIKAVRSSTDAR